MKALVTGATGFLGQALVARLGQAGWDVTATGRNKEIGARLQQSGCHFVAANLSDRETIRSLCRGQEVVFHCGALSAAWGEYQSFYQSNVLGTRYVVEGCLTYDVKRLVHVSTPSIYFQFKDQLQLKESAPLPAEKVNAYAQTKWLAEQEVDHAYQEQGLPVVTIRPRAIFGPGDQTIIPQLLRVHEQRGIPLINGGQAEIDITYIENVVDALLLCAHSSQHTVGKQYNITNGETMLFIELVKLLFLHLEQPVNTKKIPFPIAYHAAGLLEWYYRLFRPNAEPSLTRYAVGVIGKSQTLDITAAKVELGYQPRVTIEEGVKQFVTWWRGKQL